MSNYRMLAGAVMIAASGVVLAGAPAPQSEKPRFTISEETTDITGPLLPDGLPDYLGVFNAEHGKGVTPENNALLPLLEIRGNAAFLEKSDSPEEDQKTEAEFLRLIGAKPMPPGSPAFKSFLTSARDSFGGLPNDQAQKQWTDAATSLWTADKFPEIARYLGSQTHFFDLATEASKRPFFYAPLVSPDGHMARVKPLQAVGASQFGGAWEARALLRASSGDFDGALADAVALRRLGRLYATVGTTIGVLVGNIYDELGIQAVGIMAGGGKLTAEQCDRCRDAMNLPVMPNLVESRRAEEWMALDRTMLLAKNGFDANEIPDDPVAKALFNSIDFSVLNFNVMLTRIRQQSEQERLMLDAPTLAECKNRADAMAARRLLSGKRNSGIVPTSPVDPVNRRRPTRSALWTASSRSLPRSQTQSCGGG